MLHDDCEFALHVEERRTKFTVSLFIVPTVPQGALKRYIPFTSFIDNTDFQQQKLEVMTKLTALIDYMPGLRDYIIGYGRNPMTFDSHSFVSFLFKTLPLMRLLGLDIALPKSLREIVTPKVSMKIDRKDVGNTKSYVRIDELLTFDWEISLGDTSVSIEEFQEMMQHAGELIKFKERYIYATPEELEQISKQLAKGGKMTPQEILAVALAENYKDAPVTITSACRELLDKFRQLPPLPAPNGLQANLRPYQLRGYEWMVHNLSLGFGAIIADDMGLGKTIQVIAVLLHHDAYRPYQKHREQRRKSIDFYSVQGNGRLNCKDARQSKYRIDVLSWRMFTKKTNRNGRTFPESTLSPSFCTYSQGCRNRLEPHGCNQRNSFRLVVESGSRSPSHRPCLSYRTAPQCSGLSFHHQRDIRRKNKCNNPR